MKQDWNISTTKGIYKKSEPVVFRLSCPELNAGEKSTAVLMIHHFGELIHQSSMEIDGEYLTVKIPEDDIPEGAYGFGCTCRIIRNKDEQAVCTTAFDFESTENEVVRYGFLCDFRSEDAAGTGESLDFLAEFHLTHIQFYDWTWRPHFYKGPSETYTDTMGKEIDFSLVRKKISGCREKGMKSIGYGAVYAAGEDYLTEHPEQSLRDSEGSPYNLIDKFYIMDISNGAAWRKTLFEQYSYTLSEAGFDGIHMDTYGFPKRAFISGGKQLKLHSLEQDFPDLIDETRKLLGENAVLIFNNVGNWPVHATGPSAQDAVYIEVWDPFDAYSHIRRIVLDAAVFKKPVILAAYLAPFRIEEGHGGTRALNAALILHAAITSLGATHLLVGEKDRVLTQGYYNDYSELRDDEKKRLRLYYDFQVRYRDLFYDRSLSDISETHTAGENREYFFSGAPVSPDGRPGTVWVIVRESSRRKMISLVNLCSQQDSYWNRGKNDCITVNEFSVRIPDDGELKSVFTACPESAGGAAAAPSSVKIRNERGPAIEIKFPELPLWTVLAVEYRDECLGS